MGVPDRLLPPGLSESLLIPGEGRRAFRRSVREVVGVGATPATEALAAVMRDRQGEAEALAMDAADGTVDPLGDLRFFRTVAARVLDPDLAAVAAAAAGRLALRERQPAMALGLVREALERTPTRASATASLRWIEADALAELGEDDEADRTWQRCFHLLQSDRTTELAAALARRCADVWASRGDQARARRWLDHARRSGAQRPNATADALRIAGNLAAQAGELVGADALFEEAEAALDRHGGGDAVRAAIQCGRAMVDLARGEFGPADGRLARARELAGDDPLLLGLIAARQAESALRRGRRDDVEPLLAVAADRFRAAGHARGLVLRYRLLGDWHGLSGRRAAAVDAWTRGIRLARRSRDLHAARRLVRRILAVEQEGNPGPHVERWQSWLDLAEVLVRVR
jgi:tetratricopeptide (TPR) repeat protein